MNKPCLYAVFCLALLMICAEASATHLMGGDVSYRLLPNGRHEVIITVYEDCLGSVESGSRLTYAIYKADSAKTFITNRTATRIKRELLTDNHPNCAYEGYCIRVNVYMDDELYLEENEYGYLIHYSNCCRNNSILSLTKRTDGVANQGQVWQAQIPPGRVPNSSPVFLTAPIPFLCVGKPSIFNHGVFDPEGDSLVFSFSVPKGSGFPSNYPDVFYENGYSAKFPFGTQSPQITIDPVTGEITATANKAGNYVVAIEVHEYRVDPATKEAVFLGKVVRDLQFIVVPCNNNPAPKFIIDSTSVNIKNLEVGKKFCFKVTAEDTRNPDPLASEYDSLTITSAGGMFSTSLSQVKPPFATFDNVTDYKTVSSEFCWTPACHHITHTSPHILSVYVEDQGCNKIQRTYAIYVNPYKIFHKPLLHCVGIVTNNKVKLSWIIDTPATQFGKVYIYKQTGPTGSYTILDSVADFNQKDYYDNLTTDPATTSYFLRVANTCGELGVASDTVLLHNVHPAVIKNSTVNAEGAIETGFSEARMAEAETYELLRAVDSEDYSQIAVIQHEADIGTYNFTDTAVNTSENIYFYKVRTIDTCGNVLPESNPHSPVLLTGHTGYMANYLEWTEYLGYQTYMVILERNMGNGWQPLSTIVPGQYTYKDEDVECDREYSYRIKSESIDGVNISYSNIKYLPLYTSSEFTKVYLKYATVSGANNLVSLEWTKTIAPTAYFYRVYRRIPGEKYKLIHTTLNIEETTFIDSIEVQKNLCYYVVVHDYCGNESEMSNLACPVALSGRAGKLVNHITWSGYAEWAEGVEEYRVFISEDQKDWRQAGVVDGDILLYEDAELTEHVKEYCYQIMAAERSGLQSTSLSTVICLHQEPIAFFPNSFSPNISLGLNDWFGPEGMYIANYDMKIYNRWGEMVYETLHGLPWNGKTSNGRFAPEGVYVYRINVHSYNGNSYRFTGLLNLLH